MPFSASRKPIFAQTSNESASESVGCASPSVTVTEVYSGAGYRLVSDAEQTTVILPPNEGVETASVTFVNELSDENIQGYGILNEFTYDGSTWGVTQN